MAVVADTDAGATNGNATLEVRDETTGRVLRTLPAAAPIAVARKTGWVAGRTGTHEVAVWDDEGKERVRTSLPEIVDVAMSDDGARLAVAGRHRFQVLRLDSDAGAELFKDGAHEGAPGVSSVAWLGPSLLAVSGGDGIRVFDVAKGRSSAEAAYWGDGGWAWFADSFSAGWAKRLPEELSFETYSAGYYWEARRDDAALGTLLGLSKE